MNKLNLISESLNVTGKVCQVLKDFQSPVVVKNCGVRHNLNHIEIFNSSKNLVKDVSIRIIGMPPEDCWWEHPNNPDEQLLVMPYIEPNSCTKHELMFTHFEDCDVQYTITWYDWLGCKHSDTKCLHLEGIC